MRRLALCLAVAACGGPKSAAAPSANPQLREAAAGELLAVRDFDAIGDRAERSRALFGEMARVIMHPRCINCHPNGDTPHQGMQLALHDPPVVRGPDDHGVPAMECTTCHQDRNQELTRVPGAPKWHVAPIEMAWVGKSAAYICNQIKDPKRNGGKSLAQLVEHNGHDELVGWGWNPGADREKAPGTQQQFGELTAAWVETGAECPPEPIAAPTGETR
ncbi:MAG TPA: Isoquinoline 1-oxidoreductase subunit [Kofleriaceae bacterium]|nr:Isoquinoline 1-oxidoreductase subunit [Kofleriaceae bacterium]